MSHLSSGISRSLCLFLLLSLILPIVSIAQVMQGPTTIRQAVHHDVSLPLSVMAQNAPKASRRRKEAEAWKRIPLPPGLSAVDGRSGPANAGLACDTESAVGLSFEGLGQGQYGFTVQCAPPRHQRSSGRDAVRAVGELESFAVFDKATGAKLLGPVAGNTLWSGFGGGCQTNNNGDPVVQYDKLANRWVMSQFSVSTTPYLQCVAVSTDLGCDGGLVPLFVLATAIRFSMTIRRWAYGPMPTTKHSICFRTAKPTSGRMSARTTATRCWPGRPRRRSASSKVRPLDAMLPADLDGTTPPPTGSPNYMVTYRHEHAGPLQVSRGLCDSCELHLHRADGHQRGCVQSAVRRRHVRSAAGHDAKARLAG